MTLSLLHAFFFHTSQEYVEHDDTRFNPSMIEAKV